LLNARPAGLFPSGNQHDISDAHFDGTLKTNLYGYFCMARAAVPDMRPGTSIIMTGSVTGILGSGGLLDYAMTKAVFTPSRALWPLAWTRSASK
jgi:NAD(P)-dependent dehydrogenase (short-subunit alcohol dehydrogenase family)